MTDLALAAIALPPEVLEALKKKHVAFLLARLGSDAAREDWVRGFHDGYAWALGLRVRDVVDPVALTDGVTKALTAESVKALFAPASRDIHRRVLASMKKDDGRLGDYVPAQARLAIDDLLERHDLVPERLVRNIFDQEAIEEAIRDTLYDGLKEFNETVNPFFADWGLPALLKKLPIGGGTILKSMGAMRGEFDKRLDPEIRKFLLGFSRKAKGKLADFFVDKGGDPKSIELRKNVVSFLYAQSLKELLAGVDDSASKKAEIATENIVLETLRREEPRKRIREGIELFLKDQGDATFGDWLKAAGATAEPELEAWANLLWPHVQRVMQSPVAQAFFEKLTNEFYDGLASGDTSGATAEKA
ncbi:MAG: hypothetical protein JWO86_7509 [Myxococcaceae bacterium]|nr:hypothetical protein [Myxococcaceae bacterium]